MTTSMITLEHAARIEEAVELAPRAAEATRYSKDLPCIVGYAARLAAYTDLESPNYPDYPLQEVIDTLDDKRDQAAVIAGIGDTTRQEIEGFVAMDMLKQVWKREEGVPNIRRRQSDIPVLRFERYSQAVRLFAQFPGSGYLATAVDLEVQPRNQFLSKEHITALALNTPQDGLTSAYDWIVRVGKGEAAFSALGAVDFVELYELTGDKKFLDKAASEPLESHLEYHPTEGVSDINTRILSRDRKVYHALLTAGMEDAADGFSRRLVGTYQALIGSSKSAAFYDALTQPADVATEPWMISVSQALAVENPVHQSELLLAAYRQIAAPVVKQQRALPVTKLPVLPTIELSTIEQPVEAKTLRRRFRFRR